MKDVALVQNKEFFTAELNHQYLGYIPLLNSADEIEIYKFIKRNFKKKNIRKFILHVSSGVLSKFIDYIYDKKTNSSKSKKMLSKCTFVATYSNANVVRDKNIEKKTNIFFTLSPISSVLSMLDGAPFGSYLLVVCDSTNPFYDEVYAKNTITPTYRLSDPTLLTNIINYGTLGGGLVVAALESSEDYSNFVDIITTSNFTGAIAIIEVENIDLLKPIYTQVLYICCPSSGLSVTGDIEYYKDLNKALLYDNCVATLVNEPKIWNNLIRNHVISKTPANHNLCWVPDIRTIYPDDDTPRK